MPGEKRKVVTLVSGGMDSAVLVRYLQNQGFDVHALGVYYGQRHAVELTAAANICNRLDVPYDEVDMSQLRRFISRGALTGSMAVPEGHYAAESMKDTVVPNRNMILLSIATGYVLTLGGHHVAYAGHYGDHVIYPDCRLEFVSAMSSALKLCDFEPVILISPFTTWLKKDVCKYGDRHGVPFDLTYSCYNGNAKHCGKCGTCIERHEAFIQSGVEDPTVYEEDPDESH